MPASTDLQSVHGGRSPSTSVSMSWTNSVGNYALSVSVRFGAVTNLGRGSGLLSDWGTSIGPNWRSSATRRTIAVQTGAICSSTLRFERIDAPNLHRVRQRQRNGNPGEPLPPHGPAAGAGPHPRRSIRHRPDRFARLDATAEARPR